LISLRDMGVKKPEAALRVREVRMGDDGECVNGVGSVPPIRSENKILVGARITGTNNLSEMLSACRRVWLNSAAGEYCPGAASTQLLLWQNETIVLGIAKVLKRGALHGHHYSRIAEADDAFFRASNSQIRLQNVLMKSLHTLLRL
jgi:hypothetical protein